MINVTLEYDDLKAISRGAKIIKQRNMRLFKDMFVLDRFQIMIDKAMKSSMNNDIKNKEIL